MSLLSIRFVSSNRTEVYYTGKNKEANKNSAKVTDV